MARPIVCLSMIVKDEAHVIERCLASVRPHIDAWAICDTGSTDGTQALVRRLLADLPGELTERPWVDFAHNRNEALDLAAMHGSHALVIDADEILTAAPDFRWPEDEAAGYEIEYVYPPDTAFFKPAMIRLDAGWRWHGVLHETLVLPQAHVRRLAGVGIRTHADGARSRLPPAEKYARDAAVLAAALEREPDDARYWFYYAQSLRDAGRHDEAVAAYRRRVELGGWDQEVFYAAWQIGVALERCGAADETIVAAYLDAYERRPTRAEPLVALARRYRERGRHALARVFAERAAVLPMPDDALFVDRATYRWRALDELALARYYTGDRDGAASLWRALLDGDALPEGERARIQVNLGFAARPPST